MTQTTVPSEESSKLPEQVRRSAERARKFLQEKMDPKANEQPTAPDGVKVIAESQPVASAQEQPKPTEATPVQPATEDPRHSDINYWRHRVSILDGMLRKAKTNRDADVNALREQLELVQDQLHKAKTSAPMPEVDIKQYFSDEEIEALGEDQAKIHAQAIARQRHKDALQQEEERSKREKEERAKEASRAQKEAAEAHAQMLSDLEAAVPDWVAINKSQGWLDWLADTDPDTGLQRQELVDVAEGKKDGKALAKIMKRYIATLNITPVPAQPAVQPSATGANGYTPTVPVMTKGPPSRQEMQEFFKRLSMSEGRGFKPPGFRPVTPEERTEFFARLNAAQGAR